MITRTTVTLLSALALAACATTPRGDQAQRPVPPSSFAAYDKRVVQTIIVVWYWKGNAVRDQLALGSVTVRFKIDRDGRPSIISVKKERTNEMGVRIATQAILEAPLPKPPPEIWTWAGERPLEMQFRFPYVERFRLHR